jgi:hypothetical protein
MIDPGPGIPAHIALLLNEDIDLSDYPSAARKLKGMLRDLKDQSNSTAEHEGSQEEPASREFKAVLSGGLDLFHGIGACQGIHCRLGYADQISRSIALMADRVTANDYFHHQIRSLKSRSKLADFVPLVEDVAVLKRIKPLIEAGIFKFSSPSTRYCKSCMESFEERIEILTDQTLSSFKDQISVERSGNLLALNLGSIYNPPIHVRINPIYAAEKSEREIARGVVKDAVRSAFFDAQTASCVGGSIFTNSNAGISALLSEDGRLLDSSELRSFSAERAAHLPWVAGLTVQQTLSLRNEASAALPLLREFMASRFGLSHQATPQQSWQLAVAELREQAEQVRAELSLAMSRTTSLQRNASGILGLCVSAVCWAAEGPATALGGLLGTLGLIHAIPAKDSPHVAELRTRPGYILVAAEDILQHARLN